MCLALQALRLSIDTVPSGRYFKVCLLYLKIEQTIANTLFLYFLTQLL